MSATSTPTARRASELAAALRHALWVGAPGSAGLLLAAAIAAGMTISTTLALAQASECVLAPDDRNPSEKVLRCGNDITIHTATGTSYRVTEKDGPERPRAIRLDDGAIEVDFNASQRLRNFQILTPHAIAAVRGTKWAVEVTSKQSSVLAISGSVEVRRPNARRSVILRAGEGVDVSAGNEPLTVKRWAERRVRALLARFGQ